MEDYKLLTDKDVVDKINQLYDTAPETMKVINEICNHGDVINAHEATHAAVRTAVYISGLYQRAISHLLADCEEEINGVEMSLDDAVSKGQIKKIALLHIKQDAYRKMKSKLQSLNVRL
ncbi:MAG: hypothetical protein J6T22_09305 [Bacteroidales bacterium]|nr:hypothetical protein [Bacteroidales bacterium]MBO7617390.1 hypothetical protein [Bacteroidales bacterium]